MKQLLIDPSPAHFLSVQAASNPEAEVAAVTIKIGFAALLAPAEISVFLGQIWAESSEVPRAVATLLWTERGGPRPGFEKLALPFTLAGQCLSVDELHVEDVTVNRLSLVPREAGHLSFRFVGHFDADRATWDGLRPIIARNSCTLALVEPRQASLFGQLDAGG